MKLTGNHIMVDIETLSLRPSARVLQVAAVAFNLSEGIVQERVWVLDQGQQPHRHTDINTVKFWAETNCRRLITLVSGESRIEDVITGLNEMSQAYNPEGWWAHSPSFDLMILEDLFRTVKGQTPWTFRQMIDTRTLSYLTGVKVAKAKEADQHDALADAKAQAEWVVSVIRSKTS